MKEPWESCITLCTQWAWKPNDKLKSVSECIHTLVKTAGGNGNLLLNIGPMPDGRMEARQIQRLKEVGQWLNRYGSSIYGTKGGPFVPNDSYVTTRKDNKIFLHVLSAGLNRLEIPALPGAQLKKSYFMHGAGVAFTEETKGKVVFELPSVLPDANCSVIVLEFDRNVEDIPVGK
jgi:alpha-L-fucosidase